MENLTTKFEELVDAFAVIDALRGYITGNYENDLELLHKRGCTCGEEVYSEAYQMDQQQ